MGWAIEIERPNAEGTYRLGVYSDSLSPAELWGLVVSDDPAWKNSSKPHFMRRDRPKHPTDEWRGVYYYLNRG